MNFVVLLFSLIHIIFYNFFPTRNLSLSRLSFSYFFEKKREEKTTKLWRRRRCLAYEIIVVVSREGGIERIFHSIHINIIRMFSTFLTSAKWICCRFFYAWRQGEGGKFKLRLIASAECSPSWRIKIAYRTRLPVEGSRLTRDSIRWERRISREVISIRFGGQASRGVINLNVDLFEWRLRGWFSCWGDKKLN
jgi:hypothetical protein